MLKKIPIAVEDFKEIIEQDYYYVDKTKFIEDILNDGAKIKLFCRPRRFGKTLNMSMLKYFFDVKNGEDNRKLFNGLYIEKSLMMSEQGKYPVIFLSMKGISVSNIDNFLEELEVKLFELFNNFYFIEDSLTENDKEVFKRISSKKQVLLR